MKLKDMLSGLKYSVINGSDDVEISELRNNSANVGKGDVFVCITGACFDGHVFIDDVVQKGAAAVVISEDIPVDDKYGHTVFVKTDDTRLALAYMSAAFFNYPSEELTTIGVTGTKGKTTTTYMIRNILEKCGIKTGLIGTNEIITGKNTITSKRTTPESYDIHRYFREMLDSGCKCVVMEVSSQALMLHRTAGINFDIGIFTNLEADHIGPNEHSSFEEYLECKSRLFRQCKNGIVNADSIYAGDILKGHTCKVRTFGINSDADLKASGIVYSYDNGIIRTSYKISGMKNMDITLSLPGEFSVYNSLCAVSAAQYFDIPEEILKESLFSVKVTGRVEPVEVPGDFSVMIDYAHNAMSLKSLLACLKEYRPERIVVLFGCGGGRSRSRRFEMGEVAGNMADFTIITSDNPRNENPEDIMNDIETGIKKTGGLYVKIADRGEAVLYALKNAKQGDIIVLAGKGHEDYQEIMDKKIHQTDRELIESAVVKIYG